MQMSPGNAEKIVNALSAFKTYKKPKTLPDRMRLSRKHLESVKKWRNMARKKLKKGTFTSLTQLASYLPFNPAEVDDSEDDAAPNALRTDTGQPDSEKNTPPPDPASHQPEPETIHLLDLDTECIPSHNPTSGGRQSMESSLLDTYNEMFPDFFNVEQNAWDEDWESDEDDDVGDLLFGDLAPSGQRQSDGRGQGNMDAFVDDLGKTLEDFAGNVLPSMERFMAKDVSYEPYKRAKEVFEIWLEENRSLLSEEEIREREAQLQLYREIVDAYEHMNDHDYDDQKRDIQKVHATMVKLSAISGQLPNEVIAAQDEAAAGIFAQNPQMLNQALGGMVPQLTQLMTGFMGSFAKALVEGAGGEVVDVADPDVDETENCTIL